MKGTVFNIQKFSIHDGPGIRTTVFLKGCTLACDWCANPESQNSKAQLMYLEQKCNSNYACVSVCEPKALVAGEEGLKINFDACNLCGKCIDVCPENALKICGSQMSVEEVMMEVVKDMPFYENSGGGMTLSGGEPLLNINFAVELLKGAKALGIHTAVETCGMINTNSIEKALPFTDLFLYDFKMTDEGELKKMTGAEKKLVVKNLEFLNKEDAHIILRCIIIPGINDNDEHFETIADFSSKYKNIEAVNIMPYHQYGLNKYPQLGRKNKKLAAASATREQALIWRQRLEEMDCRNVSIG